MTDIVGIAHEQTRPVGVVLGDDPVEVAGVNSRSDLEAVQTALQERSRKIP